MTNDYKSVWETSQALQLAETLASLSSVQDVQSFLSDAMTVAEITEVSARLQAAKMLTEGAKYSDVIATTRLSSRTVARISDWLKNGSGGYQIALSTSQHHDQISPASAA